MCDLQYRRDAENLLDPLLSSVGAITYSNNARGRIEGHNEMADKMREYAISQGHKADYTDGYNKMSSSENAQEHRDK